MSDNVSEDGRESPPANTPSSSAVRRFCNTSIPEDDDEDNVEEASIAYANAIKPPKPTQALLTSSFSGSPISKPKRVHCRAPSAGDGISEPSMYNKPMSTWANVDEKPAPPKTFELTPLSSLLKQSFADIRALRAQQERSEGTEGCAENIDFDKVNENLRNFTNTYKCYRQYGGRFSQATEEVHVVSMVCKRSEVVRGELVAGKNVPVAKPKSILSRLWNSE